MSISWRVFLGIVLVALLAAGLLFRNFSQQFRPLLQQATEDTLVETANVLAPVAEQDRLQGRLADGRLATAVQELHRRPLRAFIWNHHKTTASLDVYVTDADGRVIYDSTGLALGQDYSRWNDVYLTLRGEYGSRSTKADPTDRTSSVMYVAAPLLRDGRIDGVLTVSRPVLGLSPFLVATEAAISREVLLTALAATVLALALAWWIARGIGQLVNYAEAVSAGRRGGPPRLGSHELMRLGRAMANMRAELDGKAYIEHYVQALTHELKSPLAAIRASAELLEGELSAADRLRFLANISREGQRAQDIIERLLELARLEQRQELGEVETVAVAALWQQVLASAESRLRQHSLRVEADMPVDATLRCERFLVQQALLNLLDNAIAFSPLGGVLRLQVRKEAGLLKFRLADDGPGIPDYAQSRLFERFYSLPRPDGQPRGTGLGLAFVRQVATLHGGSASLGNREEGGALACLDLPAAS